MLRPTEKTFLTREYGDVIVKLRHRQHRSPPLCFIVSRITLCHERQCHTRESAKRSRSGAFQGAAHLSADAHLRSSHFGRHDTSFHGIRSLERRLALPHPLCREQFREHQWRIVFDRAGQLLHRYTRRPAQGRCGDTARAA